MKIDHVILNVNDADESVAFYTRVLGFADAGNDGPFRVVRVSDDFVLLLGPWGTKGGEHLAFTMTRAEHDAVFARIREAGIRYGDSYHAVGNQAPPGRERGARGVGTSLYFHDPNQHLLEILHYDEP